MSERQGCADPGPSRPRLGTGRLGKGDSLTGREFRRLRVCCQQFRKARGIAARHAAFGGYAVDPDMAPGGGEASGVAGHVVAVNEAEIELVPGATSARRAVRNRRRRCAVSAPAGGIPLHVNPTGVGVGDRRPRPNLRLHTLRVNRHTRRFCPHRNGIRRFGAIAQSSNCRI
jgi:hypothetical protein